MRLYVFLPLSRISDFGPQTLAGIFSLSIRCAGADSGLCEMASGLPVIQEETGLRPLGAR
jgi:hypothetical protein